MLARSGGLFLRDPDTIERNRDRISRLGIPIGSLLGAGLIATSVALGRSWLIAGPALAGALIGFYPGLLANFLRLRREVWKS
jgi:hypothetical protein